MSTDVKPIDISSVKEIRLEPVIIDHNIITAAQMQMVVKKNPSDLSGFFPKCHAQKIGVELVAPILVRCPAKLATTDELFIWFEQVGLIPEELPLLYGVANWHTPLLQQLGIDNIVAIGRNSRWMYKGRENVAILNPGVGYTVYCGHKWCSEDWFVVRPKQTSKAIPCS